MLNVQYHNAVGHPNNRPVHSVKVQGQTSGSGARYPEYKMIKQVISLYLLRMLLELQKRLTN